MVQNFSSLIEAMPCACVLIGQGEKIVALNSLAQEMLGFDATDRPFVTLFREPELIKAIETMLETGEGQTTTFQLMRESGIERYDVTCRPLAFGGIVQGVLFFQNVTQQSRVEQMRKDFVANVSHELRTPLTALGGFIETLQIHGGKDPRALERFLPLMAAEARHMGKLVDDLLALSQVEADERRRLTANVDLALLWPLVQERFTGLSETQNCKIEYHSDVEQALIKGERDQLIQLLSNLVENALKYGAAGERIEIRLAAPRLHPILRQKAFCLTVEDFGAGIEEEHLPRLTERFYRIDTHRSRELGGTGLGLAIVKHIVTRHHGYFRIASSVGEGSRFDIFLPQRDDSLQ